MYLTSNNLSSLPAGIQQLRSLKKLVLSGNKLTGLPAGIVKLNNLSDLDLQINNIPENTVLQLRKAMPWCRISWDAPLTPEERKSRLLSKLSIYAQEAAANEVLLKSNPSDSLKTVAARTYNSLAYRQLMSGQFAEAEHSVLRGLELDSTNLLLYTNLPSALLLQGKVKEAQSIYMEWKDKPYQKRFFRDVFFADLETFERLSVIPPERQADVTAIKKLLAE